MARLARPDGTFSLLALDQRESLRAYLQEAAGTAVTDEGVTAFKEAALRDLAQAASGVLLDTTFGLPAFSRLGPGQGPAGMILAADSLAQDGAGAIVSTSLDPSVNAAFAGQSGCSALKLLVIWEPGQAKAERRALVGQFMALCREAGVLGLVEALMDAPTRARARAGEAALYVDMADEFARYEPDIYKTEVPGPPDMGPADLARRATAISEAVACPWVLLSNGVPPQAFPDVVAAVCAGGASGFLAGRAIWRLALSEKGYDRGRGARRRLEELSQAVSQRARPWHQA